MGIWHKLLGIDWVSLGIWCKARYSSISHWSREALT